MRNPRLSSDSREVSSKFFSPLGSWCTADVDGDGAGEARRDVDEAEVVVSSDGEESDENNDGRKAFEMDRICCMLELLLVVSGLSLSLFKLMMGFTWLVGMLLLFFGVVDSVSIRMRMRMKMKMKLRKGAAASVGEMQESE